MPSFEVVSSRNELGVLEFKRAVRAFLITAETADIAVVYYAGHGSCRQRGHQLLRSAGPTSAVERMARAFAFPRKKTGKSISRLSRRRSLKALEAIQKEFNGSQSGGKKVSLADLIVLGGSAAVEKAAKEAGVDVKVPFTAGRMDASQEQTDVESFAPLEPRADGFRNTGSERQFMLPEEALVDRGAVTKVDCPGDDGPCRRSARAWRQRWTIQARRFHQQARNPDERFLSQPSRHEHRVAGHRRGRCV
jgi:hypothetical protein